MAVAAPIRILCFGASITAGWNQLGRRYYPYASTLEARLKEALPKRHISIQVDGTYFRSPFSCSGPNIES